VFASSRPIENPSFTLLVLFWKYMYNEDNNTKRHPKLTIFTVKMQRNRIIYFNSVGV